MAKRTLDNIDRDVIAAMKLGYGVHYGRYKADYPHTREPAVVLPQPELEVEKSLFCPVCGKEFFKNRASQKYCSQECRVKENVKRNKDYYLKRHGPAPKIPCPICGKVFDRETRKQKYCSAKCVRRANYIRYERREGNE